MKLRMKRRMCDSATPWQMAAGETQSTRIADDQIVWSLDAPTVLPSIYAPGYVAISVHRNLAAVADDPSRLLMVAASLGPLLSDQFLDRRHEPVSLWAQTAAQMQEARTLLDKGKFDPLSIQITAGIADHGAVMAPSDDSNWIYDFNDLIGAAWFDTALDLFAAINGKPREYGSCQVCTRHYLKTRKDQRNCSSACNNKASRVRGTSSMTLEDATAIFIGKTGGKDEA